MNKDKTSIVVFLESKPFLGRQIAQIPFFENMRASYPEHNIIGVSQNEKTSEILEYFGLLDKVWFYEENKSFLTNARLVTYLKKQKPEAIFQLKKDSDRNNLLAYLVGCPKRIGFKGSTAFLLSGTHTFDTSHYLSYNYIKLLHQDNICISKPHKKVIDRCVIIPIAGRHEKIYHISKFIRIAHEIERYMPVTFIIQSNYAEIKKTLLSNFPPENVLCDINLKNLRDYLVHSKIILSNDCGPVHFAHIYDKLRIVLYKDRGDKIAGPITQWFYETPSSRCIISKTGKINDIPSDEIVQTFKELYE